MWDRSQRRREGGHGGLLIAVLSLLALLGGGCGPSTPAAPDLPRECVERFEPGRDYFPDKASVRYAEQLRIEYFRHYKVVTIAQPWVGATGAQRSLLLLCGTPLPREAAADAPKIDTAVIEIPARRVITTSTTEIPHIVDLGLVDRLVGHDELDFVTAPEVRRRAEAGAIREVGTGTGFNAELVVEIGPDLLLADSLGDPENQLFGKLREAGVPVALSPSFLETSPLGRAEWIKHTALYFNREARAEELFDGVAARYEELAGRVTAALARGDIARPTVFTSGPLGDVWYVPGGRSYLANLLRDAGAEYLWAEDASTGSLALDLESVYERAFDADFWLQPGSFESLGELAAADVRLAAVAAFRQRHVYNYDARRNGRGGNDYWETGSSRPDLVLADLVRIFHPALVPDHELIFHRQLPDLTGGAAGAAERAREDEGDGPGS